MTINQVVLIGKLSNDPQHKTTSSGINVSKFNIALERNHTNPQGIREVDYPQIITWRNLSDLTREYLYKGREVCVTGELRTRTYLNEHDETVFVTEVLADKLKIFK